MNSPENARLALRRPQELVPQPEAGDSLEAHCGPDDRPSRRDLAEGRPSGVNLHQRVLMVRALACVRAAFLSACTAACLVACASTTPLFPPTYSQAELKGLCERHGGCWHPDDLVGG